jgi:threonine/homoserine/homoserine lactone efflux protein
MELIFLIKGMIIGFCVAAPVGPIGILCIRRTLQFGRLSGLFSGLGAATADMTYGAIAAFGVTLVSDLIMESKVWFHFFGGVVLLVLGAYIFLSKPKEAGTITHKTLVSDFFSTFFLTLANPLTVIAFLAIFAGVGLSEYPTKAPIVVLGIFAGAASWWILLSEGVTFFRYKINHTVMLWINYMAGALIFLLGIVALTFTWCVDCRI